MRVNARLDGAYEAKLAYLMECDHTGVSAVLKKAVDAYYQQKKREETNALGILESSGFVGCAEGPESLSETYKRDLTQLLSEKW